MILAERSIDQADLIAPGDNQLAAVEMHVLVFFRVEYDALVSDGLSLLLHSHGINLTIEGGPFDNALLPSRCSG
jgi:hypothetical protein